MMALQRCNVSGFVGAAPHRKANTVDCARAYSKRENHGFDRWQNSVGVGKCRRVVPTPMSEDLANLWHIILTPRTNLAPSCDAPCTEKTFLFMRVEPFCALRLRQLCACMK
jgi:hypothetical protein